MVEVTLTKQPTKTARSFLSREDAERWAGAMILHGFGPATIDGLRFISGED